MQTKPISLCLILLAVFLNISAMGQTAIAFSYDAAGNRTRKEVVPCSTPVITPQQQVMRICTGTSASFKVVAHSPNPLTYQWKKNSVVVGTDSILSISSPSAGVYSYTCVVTGCGGFSATSLPATLTVDAPSVAGYASARDVWNNDASLYGIPCFSNIQLNTTGSTGTATWFMQTPEVYEYANTNFNVYCDLEGTYSFYAVVQNGVCSSVATQAVLVPVYGGDWAPKPKKEETEGQANALAEGLLVSPNPNQGQFTVSLGALEEGDGQLTIKDATGRPVKTEKFNKSGFSLLREFSLQGLNAGIYFVEITIGDVHKTSKFVVVK